MVEREGRIVAKVVPNTQAATLMPHVAERTMPRSTVFTDEYVSYNPLEPMGYEHKRVHHATKVLVSGDAHTNTIEGFWSLTKNGIRGVYHSVGAHYLQTYLNEYAFRFNRRKSLGRHNMFEAFTHKNPQSGLISVSGAFGASEGNFLASFPLALIVLSHFATSLP